MVDREIISIIEDAVEAYEEREENTYVYVYYRGPSKIVNGKVVIPCGDGDYALEEKLFDTELRNAAILWAVLDCPRNNIESTSSIEAEEDHQRHPELASAVTYACRLGQDRTINLTSGLEFYFASKLEYSPTGSFDLREFLSEMPRDLGITTVYQEAEWPLEYIWQAEHNNSHVWEKLSPSMYKFIKKDLEAK